MPEKPEFRADIEALRAVAVLAVVLFHAHVPGFSGGFFGVDIFFVISGFLITGVLVRELERTSTINLVAFWARRAWRLLPNALLVFCVSLAAMRLLVPATEHAMIGRDIVSAILYFANYHFAGRALDYFDHAQTLSPVLHFWSLSVEEQFYAFVPCLLLVVGKLAGPTNRRPIIVLSVGILALSYACAVVWSRYSQPNAFFNTESRIWELCVGGILMLILPHIESARPGLRKSMAWCGLLGIAASIVLLNDRVPRIELFAPLPVLSTAALIAAGVGPKSALGRLSALAPLQWIGRRSYSIYLWHWPILVFLAPALPPTVISTAAVLAAILATSALAFSWIEDPLRHFGATDWRPLTRLAALLSASATVAACTLVVSAPTFLHGDKETQRIAKVMAAEADIPSLAKAGCRDNREETDQACRYGAANGAKRVVLFGDSYARALFDGMDAAARNAGWALQVSAKLNCPPILTQARDRPRGVSDHDCERWRSAAIERLLKDPPDLVVITSWLGVANHFITSSATSRSSARVRMPYGARRSRPCSNV